MVLLKRMITILKQKTALTTAEKKIPGVNKSVKKGDYNTKVTEIENKLNNHNHDQYIDTSEFNKSAVDVFNARVAKANLVTKTDLDAKLSRLNRKITKNKTDHLIVKSELNNLKTFDLIYKYGKSYFEEDEKPNYLIFQPLNKYFKLNIHYLSYVSSRTSKGFSDESIKPLTTSNNSLTPIINYYGPK